MVGLDFLGSGANPRFFGNNTFIFSSLRKNSAGSHHLNPRSWLKNFPFRRSKSTRISTHGECVALCILLY